MSGSTRYAFNKGKVPNAGAGGPGENAFATGQATHHLKALSVLIKTCCSQKKMVTKNERKNPKVGVFGNLVGSCSAYVR